MLKLALNEVRTNGLYLIRLLLRGMLVLKNQANLDTLISVQTIPDADTTTLQMASVDLSRPPPVAPPEFRRSQLFKSPEEFEALDNQVFEVSFIETSHQSIEFAALGYAL